ncbi:hypothetical protein FKM82_016743 [Ascaphus truei]
MASPIMQFLQQLVPPASFPLPQATPYQWVRRSAPHRRVDKAGECCVRSVVKPSRLGEVTKGVLKAAIIRHMPLWVTSRE